MKSSFLTRCIPTFVVLAIPFLSSCRSTQHSRNPVVSESLVVDTGGVIGDKVYSDDYSHYALEVACRPDDDLEGVGFRILRDGEWSTPGRSLLSPLFFSPDGTRLVYSRVGCDGRPEIVNNDIVLPASGYMVPDYVVFSADGAHYAWVQWRSPDGYYVSSERSLNKARLFSRSARVYVDGVKITEAPSVSDVLFAVGETGEAVPVFTSMDESGMLWSHRGDKITQLVRGYCRGSAGAVVTSSDGKRSAFYVQNISVDTLGTTMTLYVDEEPLATYSDVGMREIVYNERYYSFFSPDGAHFAFNAFRNGEYMLVRDGRECRYDSAAWLDVLSRVYTPAISRNGQVLHSTVNPDGRMSVYIDDKLVYTADVGVNVEYLRFSPDGRHYIAVLYNPLKRRCSMLIDGRVGAAYSDVGLLSGRRKIPPCYSPNGQHVAYPAARHDNIWLVVCDGREIDVPGPSNVGEKNVLDALWFVSDTELGYYRLDGKRLMRGTIKLR